MRNPFIILTAVFALFLAPVAHAADGDIFPYPKVPDEITELSDRCNYLVEHFWDQCNMKAALSHRENLEDCFDDWLQFMPYATTEVVFPSIDKFLEKISKSPEQTLMFGQWAEYHVYSDSAAYVSHDIYLPFAKAVVAHKKIKSADKARFQAQVQVIEHSTVGRTIPAIEAVGRDGSRSLLTEFLASDSAILFFNDPDCFDCRLARTRLSADINLNRLIEQGVVQMISIYPGEADDEEWAASAAGYPEAWTVVAVPEVDLYFDLRETPRFYIVDHTGKVTAADVPMENLITAFRVLNQE